jgi:hypothetical protein
MGARGVHFALTAEDEQKLLASPADKRVDFITDEIEETYIDGDWQCETDKAWDAIHRAFSASELDYEYLSPLHGVVLGGEPLYFKDDYIISLKSIERVREIAGALNRVTEASFRPLYFAIDPKKYGFNVSDEDYAYTWDWLKGLVPFYLRAAEAGRPVIFTADQ